MAPGAQKPSGPPLSYGNFDYPLTNRFVDGMVFALRARGLPRMLYQLGP